MIKYFEESLHPFLGQILIQLPLFRQEMGLYGAGILVLLYSPLSVPTTAPQEEERGIYRGSLWAIIKLKHIPIMDTR